MTPTKPSSRASTSSSMNSVGSTHRSTGWCRGEGRRYWVMVTRSQPAARRSCRAAVISASFLAETEDEVRLGDQTRCPGLGQHVEGARVAESRTDPLEDPRNGLDVVCQHLGAGVEDLGEQVRTTGEVGDEHLDPAAGDVGVYTSNGLGVEPRSLVGEVVPGNAGHRRIAQSHPGDRLRDAPRLIAVELCRATGVDLTEVAPPGALVTADEEGGLPVLPALEDVRASGLLADGVQALVPHQFAQLGVLRAHVCPRPNPGRFPLDGGLAVAHLEP